MCTYPDCPHEAIYFDRRYPTIRLCADHFLLYSQSFAEWLWTGTPGSLRAWIDVFTRCGGVLR